MSQPWGSLLGAAAQRHCSWEGASFSHETKEDQDPSVKVQARATCNSLQNIAKHAADVWSPSPQAQAAAGKGGTK